MSERTCDAHVTTSYRPIRSRPCAQPVVVDEGGPCGESFCGHLMELHETYGCEACHGAMLAGYHHTYWPRWIHKWPLYGGEPWDHAARVEADAA